MGCTVDWQFSFRVGRAMMQFSIPYLFHSIPVSSNLHLSISSPSSRLNNKAAVPTWFCASSGISGSAFNPPSCGNLREFAGWYQKLSNILNLSQSISISNFLTTSHNNSHIDQCFAYSPQDASSILKLSQVFSSLSSIGFGISERSVSRGGGSWTFAQRRNAQAGNDGDDYYC